MQFPTYKEAKMKRDQLEIERKYWLIREDGQNSALALANFQAKLVPILEEYPGCKPMIFDGYDIYLTRNDSPPEERDFTFARIRQNVNRRQTSVKGWTGDATARREINIPIPKDYPEEELLAYHEMLGWQESFRVFQSGNIYEIPGLVEIVVYWSRRCPQNDYSRAFVEIEALGGKNLEEALEIIQEFEGRLGLLKEDSCPESIFEIYSGLLIRGPQASKNKVHGAGGMVDPL